MLLDNVINDIKSIVKKKIKEMKNNFNIDLMIERAMTAFECRTQKQLSELFGVSPENFSAKKKRGTLTKLIEKEAFRREINYDWIKTGVGNMRAGSDNMNSVREQQQTYNGTLSRPPLPMPTSDLLLKTAQVLESESIYGTALKSNIEAFHHALITDGEMKQMHNRLDNIDTEMKSMQDRLKRQEEELSSRELYPKSG